MSGTRGVGLLAATLIACSPAPSPHEAAPPPAVSASTAPPPAPSATATAAAPPATPWFPALTSPSSFELYRVSNAVLAMRDRGVYEFSVAEGDDFVARPELSKGIP